MYPGRFNSRDNKGANVDWFIQSIAFIISVFLRGFFRLGPQIADALPLIRKRLQGLVVQLMAVVFLSWR